MHGVILPLPQYAFMAWYLVKRSTGTTLPLHLHIKGCGSLTATRHVERRKMLKNYTYDNSLWQSENVREEGTDQIIFTIRKLITSMK
jgi:hypothetical protein